jgi:PAS domain S-box-containing protein
LLKKLPAGHKRSPASELLVGWAKVITVGAAYYVAARLGLRLALIEENVTPLWPPSGIALVAFLVLGRGVWPGIALAALLVNAPISTTVWAAAATAAGNTVAPLLAADLLRLAGFRREIDRVRDATAIVFLAALAAMLVSASVGAGALILSGAIAEREFPAAWAVWWTGDAMGILVVAPFILSLFLVRLRPRTSWRRMVEAAGLFVLLTALTLVVTRTSLGLLFLVLPLLGWAAWRFQLRGSAPAALLVAGIATWAATHAWGPFAEGPLFHDMLVLQAFNATVAFTSLFFAALVTERMRDRDAVERAAAELEERVRRRTAELFAANERLTSEIAERKDAEGRLRQQERQLVEAQQVARIGSWEWDVQEASVMWSAEMYRIHGYRPNEFPVTFDRAVQQVVPEDLERIQKNTSAALQRGKNHSLPKIEYRIIRADGSERTLLGKARLQVGPTGEPERLVGTVQDITEDKQAEREHRISETLQRSLLPDRLPDIPGVMLAARYVPATSGIEVGGDWYDVVQLPNGHVGVAIGDVAGHGLRAASTMGQLRMSLRAHAIEEGSPAKVVGRVHHLVKRLLLGEMATLLYLVFDPDNGTVRFANAGHPPPLLIPERGEASFVTEGLAPPLGAARSPNDFVEAGCTLAVGSTLLLFTDGLVEERGVSIQQGLARLKEEATTAGPDLETLCDHLLATLPGSEVSDDIALLALRPVPFSTESIHLRMPAEPHVLAPLRHTLRRWLREIDASARDSYEILVACGEACANAIQHPYGAREGLLEVNLDVIDGEVEITVRDAGSWRLPSTTDGGRGLHLIEALMEGVEVESDSGGTVVRMRRRLEKAAG